MHIDERLQPVPEPTDPAQAFRIAFATHPSGLRVHVAGADATLAITLAYWQQIALQVQQRKPAGVLLVDELTGPPLAAADWEQLVRQMEGGGFEDIRIAHVKPHGLQQVEFCELFAKEAGFDARVFDDETQADLWLRYGER